MRAHLLLAAVVLGACTPKAPIERRSATALPALDLGWISLRDHFLQTVGPRSGEGAPLSDLLVLADTTIAPRSSFPMHPHRNMEIISVVLQGTLLHRDDQGRAEQLPTGSVQLMSTGSGVVHAEGNPSDEPVRMLQIWIRPTQAGGEPRYLTGRLAEGKGELVPVVGTEQMPLRQQARVLHTRLEAGQQTTYKLPAGHIGYAIVTRGSLRLNGERLEDGDGARVGEGRLRLEADGPGELLLFTLRADGSPAGAPPPSGG